MFALVLASAAYISHGRRNARKFENTGAHSLVDVMRSELERRQEVPSTPKASPFLLALNNFNRPSNFRTLASHMPSGLHPRMDPREEKVWMLAGGVSRNDCADLAGADFEKIVQQLAPESDLLEIRQRLSEVDDQLNSAVELNDFKEAASLRDEKRALRKKDPKLLLSALEEARESAVEDERYGDAARLRDQLRIVQKHLPQFKLAGLWKGKYGDHGEAVIRISYEGDMMLAKKVTGDPHVPAGEVTFRADLSSNMDRMTIESADDDTYFVEALELKDGEIMKREQKKVEEFIAEGMIATKGYEHAHFVPGRLFLLDETTIGFLWVPIGQFVTLERMENEIDPDEAAIEEMREKLELQLGH
jgi:hypothetical protein